MFKPTSLRWIQAKPIAKEFFYDGVFFSTQDSKVPLTGGAASKSTVSSVRIYK
jgi:hypothetical protein